MAQEAQPQTKQPTKALPTSVIEELAQALEDAQAAGEPVAEIAAAMADGKDIKVETIEDAGAGQLIVITAEPEATEATEAAQAEAEAVEAAAEATEPVTEPEADAQPADSRPIKMPARKGKGKKSEVPHWHPVRKGFQT